MLALEGITFCVKCVIVVTARDIRALKATLSHRGTIKAAQISDYYASVRTGLKTTDVSLQPKRLSLTSKRS